MSFAIESWKSTLKFMVKYPKVILFAGIVQLVGLVGWFLTCNWFWQFGLWGYRMVIELPRQYSSIVNLLVSIPTIPDQLGLGVLLPGGSILVSWWRLDLGYYSLLTVSHVLDLLVSLIVYLIAAIGFPVVVSQGFEGGNVSLRLVFKGGLSRVLNVLSYIFAMLGIVLALGVGGGLVVSTALILTRSVFVAFVIGLIIVLFSVFIMLRLWLVLPVLLVESSGDADPGNIGVLEAFRRGYRHTDGNELSILGTQILTGITVLLPFNLVNFLVQLLLTSDQYFNFISFPPLFSIPQGSLIYLFWDFAVGITGGSFASILPTVYYYISIKQMKV